MIEKFWSVSIYIDSYHGCTFWRWRHYFYASAFKCWRHYVFGLSVRPAGRQSVRSLKYLLLTCTWVRWSTRPTVTVLRHVRPSVRRGFPGICRRRHGGNGLKFYMLMYLDHLQNWLVYGHGLLIFVILALFWLCETGQIWGFRAFPWERMEEMAWNFARWSWPLSELISLWPRSVYFYNFGTILTLWNGSNLGFPGISRRTHEGNGLKFCMLMYLDHLQSWLVYGHGLLIFVNLALFWLSEMGQIWGFRAFPGERVEGMAWNFAGWCISPPSELISLWSRSVDFCKFCTILT